MTLENASKKRAMPLRDEGSSPTPMTMDRQPTWVDVANIYAKPVDCLAGVLVSLAAEVLVGEKPANLVNILPRKLPCGSCLLELWQAHGEQLLKNSPLEAITLRQNEGSILLLIYHPHILQKRLVSRTMRAFLSRIGYPSQLQLAEALAHLAKRFSSGNVPCEVGMFLGYPRKDVVGFMEQRDTLWCGGACLWRVYGPPARSLRLNFHYRAQRRNLTGRLMSGIEPLELLHVA